ncbi:MAG: transketolase [Gammaproteobacteria bacterium]
MPVKPDYHQLASALRALSIDAVERANSGHPGMPMGMADAAAVLFADFMKFSAADPKWHDRDRFILSAGHGSMLLYALLHLTGYADFPLAQLQNFRQLKSRAAGHPEYGNGGGIETTTGPLAQGFANGVGMAIAEKTLAAQFGKALCDHRTWVIAGDGCLMEGLSHEAAELAGHLQLAKLTVLFDDNGISIDGAVSLTQSGDILRRFQSYGWRAERVDGHNAAQLRGAIQNAIDDERPALIACRTIIGKGAPNKQGSAAAHGAPLGAEEAAAAKASFGWRHKPFVIPAAITRQWRHIGKRGDGEAGKWRRRVQKDPQAEVFLRRVNINNADGKLPRGWRDALQQWQKQMRQTKPKMATRQASGKTLELLAAKMPELLGGSADLSGSNNTRAGQKTITATSPDGGYIHYGVREHLMAAAMNGIALHGGFIPYGGTFLVFSDYCRPSIRLAAMMNIRAIYVMTHDSIGLGEDGPTHQPVEHLASLRVMPNLRVWRPCDAEETAQCWQLALQRKDGPSLLALSRQALPYCDAPKDACAAGGYVIGGTGKKGGADITIAASGSEVHLALAAKQQLAKSGIDAAVVSVPCLELFNEQKESLRRRVIINKPLLAVEAASPLPWLTLSPLASKIKVCGINTFGISAPAAQVFTHFRLTPRAITTAAKKLLSRN